MKPWIPVLLLGLFTTQWLHAAPAWEFKDPVAIGADARSGVFHHLDGAGRKHIAVSSQTVAVVWEDNHLGEPQVFVALKSIDQPQFSEPMSISSGHEAFEPSIAALTDNRFMVIWEQDASVFAGLIEDRQLKTKRRLTTVSSSHGSVATVGDLAFVTWREQQGREWRLKVAQLTLTEDGFDIEAVQSVEAESLSTPVLFPTISASGSGICVAWEDRRAGHTRLLFSYSKSLEQGFSSPQSLNEYYSNRNEYDKGNGVTRVSMAAFAEDEVVAAWMDKRRGHAGYGIFAALGSEGGESFGPNEKVHGQEGDELPHYNPATAGNADSDFVVAWDDFRRGDADIWLGGYNDEAEWGENISPEVASGRGEQSHPSVALDDAGHLHLLWIERSDLQAPTRLWYSQGVVRDSE